MSENLHYANAPIVEALLDIRVPIEVSREALLRMSEELKAEYPTCADTTERDAPPTQDGSPRFAPGGLTARRASESHAYRIEPSGMTVSRLKPYQDWADLRAESQRIWEIYQRHSGCTSINKIGLRYINLIDIPIHEDGIDLSEWFNASVSVPQGYEAPAAGSAYRLVMPIKAFEGWCFLMGSTVPSNEPEKLKFMLDIHVFKAMAEPISPSSIWDLFEKLRVEKNRFFEETITERTKGLFNAGT